MKRYCSLLNNPLSDKVNATECSSQRFVDTFFIFVANPSYFVSTTMGKWRHWSGGSGHGFALMDSSLNCFGVM